MEDWRENARCADNDVDSEAFFDEERVDEAKAVCKTCPVQKACLESVMGLDDVSGIWGGTTEDERLTWYTTWRNRRRAMRGKDSVVHLPFPEYAALRLEYGDHMPRRLGVSERTAS